MPPIAPDLTSTTLLTRAPGSVARARRLLKDDLRRTAVPESLVQDALLVLSELVSNALKHAQPLPDCEADQVQVRWSADSAGVYVEVTDGGADTRPRIRRPDRWGLGGRGLAIVADLAQDWGVQQDGTTTTVWAQLPLPATSDPEGGPRR